MKAFTRTDGCDLKVVEGFRKWVLSLRTPVTPKPDWDQVQYAAAAQTKQRRARRLLESFRRWFGPLAGARLLDVGCGDGTHCLVLGQELVRLAVGIDLTLPLLAADAKGEQTRRLAARVGEPSRLSQLSSVGLEAFRGASKASGAGDLPVSFVLMNATRMGFGDGSFDVLMSRSATEHIRPIEAALSQMARVVRSGGLIYLGIDPFYWLRGCHKRGVVDMPWAHARLTPEEFRRFVSQSEGEEVALKRCQRLESLNRFTVRHWRNLIDSMACEVLAWNERPSVTGQQVLAQHPEVLKTLLPGVTKQDLLCERIKVWLRRT